MLFIRYRHLVSAEVINEFIFIVIDSIEGDSNGARAKPSKKAFKFSLLCVFSGVFKCKAGKWKCKTLDVCIDMQHRCDYQIHCGDDSDEQECPTTPAPTTTTTPAPTTPPSYLQFSIYCTELTVMGVWEKWIFKTKGL